MQAATSVLPDRARKTVTKSKTKIIAFSNAKGGTGKTTVALNLAATLAATHHLKILTVDLDPQGTLGVGLGVDPRTIDQTAFDLIKTKGAEVESFTVPVRKNLYLIPNRMRAGSLQQLMMELDRERLLTQKLEKVREKYDYIILDTPPQLEVPTHNALVAADAIVIVLDCGYYALYGVNELTDAILSIKERFQKPGLTFRALINHYDHRQKIDRDIKAEIESAFGDNILHTVIRKNVRLVEAASAGRPICEFEPSSSGAQDFKQLAEEVIKLYE